MTYKVMPVSAAEQDKRETFVTAYITTGGNATVSAQEAGVEVRTGQRWVNRTWFRPLYRQIYKDLNPSGDSIPAQGSDAERIQKTVDDLRFLLDRGWDWNKPHTKKVKFSAAQIAKMTSDIIRFNKILKAPVEVTDEEQKKRDEIRARWDKEEKEFRASLTAEEAAELKEWERKRPHDPDVAAGLWPIR